MSLPEPGKHQDAGRAVVLGGTGMLAGVAASLVRDGWLVVLPSRRYGPLPDTVRDAGPDDQRGRGRALWVQAQWERPQRLAHDTANALGGPVDLLVAWVHGGYRDAVLHAVEPLLAADAPVVEVHGASAGDPPGRGGAPTLTGHPTQQVVLGYVRDGTRTRWLTHAEIVDGVLVAVRRALDDAPIAEHYVGESSRAWAP
ncbi:MAG: hypothetical protein ACRDQB_03265 [Thermocrispum sp.]